MRSDKRAVAIVVPVWNAREHLERLVQDLEDHWPENARVIFVDNGSTDGAKKIVADLCYKDPEKYQGHFHESNLGFTAAVNRGICMAGQHEDIVLMNTDIRLGVLEEGDLIPQTDWLDLLREQAEVEGVGIVAPRSQGLNNVLHSTHAYLNQHCRGFPRPEFVKDRNQYNRGAVIDTVAFSCVYITRECFEAVGLLEDALVNYGSDTWFTFMAQHNGLATVRHAGVTLTHATGASTPRDDDAITAQMEADRQRLKQLLPGYPFFKTGRPPINIHGALGFNTGYGKLAWNIARALDRRRLQVSCVPYTTDRPMNIVDEPIYRDLCQRYAPRDAPTLLVGVASESKFWSSGRNIAITMLECEPIPPFFARDLNNCDEVWTYSAFNRRGFEGAGVERPIRVLPPPLDTDLYHPDITPMRLKNGRDFNIVTVFEWGPRKWPAWIKLALETFRTHEDVAIYARVFGDRTHTLRQLSGMTRKVPGVRPPVYWLDTFLPESEMGALYAAADLVVAIGAEGIGMPAIEALACGTPVIAFNWGAGAEHMTKDRALLVEPLTVGGRAVMQDASGSGPYYQGGRWAVPDLMHFQRLLLWAYHHRDKLRRRARRAASGILEECNLDRIGEVYEAALFEEAT